MSSAFTLPSGSFFLSSLLPAPRGLTAIPPSEPGIADSGLQTSHLVASSHLSFPFRVFPAWRINEIFRQIGNAVEPHLNHPAVLLFSTLTAGLAFVYAGRLPVLSLLDMAFMAVMSMATNGNTSPTRGEPENDSYETGTLKLVSPSMPPPEDPEGGTNPDTIRETVDLLRTGSESGLCLSLCSLLTWLSPEEMRQVVRQAAEDFDTEAIVRKLALAVSQARNERQLLMLLQLTSCLRALPPYTHGQIKPLFDALVLKLPPDSFRKTAWKEWEVQLRSAVHSRDSETDRIDMEIRTTAWKTGHWSPLVDKIVNLAPRTDSEGKKISQVYLLSAWEMIKRLVDSSDPIRFYLEVRYISDRISAAGDLVRSKMILTEAIAAINDARAMDPAEKKYIAHRLKALEDGVMTAMQWMIFPDQDSLHRIVSSYVSKNYSLMPPVHTVIRTMRQSARISSAKGRIDEQRLSAVYAAVSELARMRIIGPLLNDIVDQGGELIGSQRKRLLDAFSRGDGFSREEWNSLVLETADLLLEAGHLETAHDFLRALQKLDVCDDRIFPDLAMSLVTNAEIRLHGQRDGSQRESLNRLLGKLVAWRETFDH